MEIYGGRRRTSTEELQLQACERAKTIHDGKSTYSYRHAIAKQSVGAVVIAEFPPSRSLCRSGAIRKYVRHIRHPRLRKRTPDYLKGTTEEDNRRPTRNLEAVPPPTSQDRCGDNAPKEARVHPLRSLDPSPARNLHQDQGRRDPRISRRKSNGTHDR